MNMDLDRPSSMTATGPGTGSVLGRVWADAVGAWLALADAGNMLNARFDASALEEQNDAIEQALASRRPAVSAVPGVRDDMQAAA
jgi:hypothetical protein